MVVRMFPTMFAILAMFAMTATSCDDDGGGGGDPTDAASDGTGGGGDATSDANGGDTSGASGVCAADLDLPSCQSCCGDAEGYDGQFWGGLDGCVCTHSEVCVDASPVDCSPCCEDAGYPGSRRDVSTGECECTDK